MKWVKYVLYLLGVVIAILFGVRLLKPKKTKVLFKDVYDRSEEDAKKAGKKKEEELQALPAAELANLYPGIGRIQSEARSATDKVRRKLRNNSGRGEGDIGD